MTTATRRASRAFGPGSRRPVRLALAGLAVAAAVSAGVVSTQPKGSPPKTPTAKASSARYGGIPSWLPKATLPVGRTVTASAAHPWPAIEGDTVSVHLVHGRVLATAVGPAVPEQGRFPVPSTSPCSFTVTFTAASGDVPLSANAFTIVDEFGHLHHPRVTSTGGGSPPLQVAAGRTVSLTVSDVLPTGNGQLRWASEGTTPIVSWDFDVELD